MGCVDHHQTKAGLFGHAGRLSPGLHDAVDHVLGHLMNLLPGGHGQVAGAVGLTLTGCTGAANAGQAGIHAAVGQLDIGNGASPVDGVHRAGQARKDVGIVHGHLPVMAAAGGGIHNTFPQRNDGCAAGGLPSVVSHIVIRQVTLGCKAHHTGRRGKDTVFYVEISHLQRSKEMRILQLHVKHSFLMCGSGHRIFCLASL